MRTSIKSKWVLPSAVKIQWPIAEFDAGRELFPSAYPEVLGSYRL